MSQFQGHDHTHVGGSPHQTKIKRKPKGVGVEVKNVADVESGIMFFLVLCADKKVMAKRSFNAELGSGTGVILRVLEGIQRLREGCER